jgi:hypothetical protein
MGISVRGGAALEHRSFLRLPVGGSISQEVRREDKMATDSQNGDIITLLALIIWS